VAPKKDPGLSDSDRAALDHARAEIEEEKHRAWLFAWIKRIAGWITATIAFLVVIWDFGVKLIKSLGP
jgi:hypothetical protein